MKLQDLKHSYIYIYIYINLYPIIEDYKSALICIMYDFFPYPLVNCPITMENHHLQWIYPLKMVDLSIVMWLFTRGYFLKHRHNSLQPIGPQIFAQISTGLVAQKGVGQPQVETGRRKGKSPMIPKFPQ